MNSLQVFPVDIFWWDWDGDINDILEVSKSIHPNHNQIVSQSNNDIHKKQEYKKLFEFIEQCLGEVKNHYNFQCDYLKVTSSWINKYKETSTLNFHRHPMSAFSGVFFMTGGSPISFKDPIDFRTYQSTIPVSKNDCSYFNLEPIPGRVIIFPWWLEHGVMNFSGERWSLAFNSMPGGKINSDDHLNLSFADLEVNG